jgi:chromosome segregation ATPase
VGQSPQAKGQGAQDRTQVRIHATDQQRDQLKTCDLTADRIRTQARTLADAAKGSGANSAEFLRQRDQLRDQVRTMEQEHERLLNGLGAGQRTALEERLREMTRERQRLNTQLQSMNQELQNANPNRARIAEHAGAIEQAMNEWQKQSRAMQAQMAAQ